MTHQAPPASAPTGPGPGRQIAQLREALRLVERLAGQSGRGPSDAQIDEAARISIAYDRALPIVQRRFDAIAAETAAWAAAGVEALLAGGDEPRTGAATSLAVRIEDALQDLSEMLS